LEYISVGLERLILFLNPTVVLLLGMLLYKRRVSAQQWISMALAYGGILLVFWSDIHVSGASTSRLVWGTGIVFTAAVTYGFYLLMSGEVVKRYGSLRLVSLAMLVSTVYSLIHFVVRDWLAGGTGSLLGLFHQTPTVWVLSGLNAVFCTVLPVTMLMVAVSRLGAATAAQAGMVGPVATIFLGYFYLGELITPMQILGTALVMVGIVVLSRVRH
jgi:drug/metabolite transporter (DMT)-like permease